MSALKLYDTKTRQTLEFKPIKKRPIVQANTKKITGVQWGVTKSPAPLEKVFRPTIGPNKAKEIKPVNKLSLIIILISVDIKLSQYLVYLENLLERISM